MKLVFSLSDFKTQGRSNGDSKSGYVYMLACVLIDMSSEKGRKQHVATWNSNFLHGIAAALYIVKYE